MTGRAKASGRRDVMARLRNVLRDEVDDKRTCVLVLGDGLNRQAARQPWHRASDWQDILSAIWLEAGGVAGEFPQDERSSSASWATLVAEWAAHHRVSAQRAEREVSRRVCTLFAPIEGAAKRRDLYRTLLDGRLANVVSFSVDRRLVLQSDPRRVAPRYPKRSFLERHLEVTGTRGTTRVWFPYGNTSQPRSIDPGYSTFDDRLMALERARAALMDEHNEHHYGWGPGLREPTYIYEKRWHAPETWCELFMCAPLVFVGASLPVDDWPLWWLLHQRMRYFVAFKDSEVYDTFYLTSRPEGAGHVANGAAGLETVTFKNDGTLWDFVLSVLESPGVDLEPGLDRRFGPRSRPEEVED